MIRLLLALLPLLALDATPPTRDLVAVRAAAVPLDPTAPSRSRVGRLRYLGGLVLTSGDRRWGGLSGLRWDGAALLAVSDEGRLFRLVPVERGGRLVDVGPVRAGGLPDEDGRALAGKGDADAEALNLTGGKLQVSFERRHRVLEWRLAIGWPVGPPRPFTPALDPAGLPANSGFEAFAAGDRLVVGLPERARDATGDVPAQLRLPRMPEVPLVRMPVPVAPEWEPTDAVMLDGDDAYLLLSRHVSLTDGANARVDLVQPAPADGDGRAVVTPLGTLSPPLTVDNMEGIAVRRQGGRTFLYLVSDNNFSPLQRTLLMKFEVVG